MRQNLCRCLYVITNNRWQPWYPSAQVFLLACNEEPDPLHIRYVGDIHRRSSLLTFSLGKLFT